MVSSTVKTVPLNPPLGEADVEHLEIGDKCLISGVIYSARDAAHKRFIELLDRGEGLPFNPRGQILYYVGPTPAPPGRVIGSAGPTTAYRMDMFTPRLLELGLKATIGKGQRTPAVREALKRHKALYLVAIGGTGALLSERIEESEVIAFPDLGPEAVFRLKVRDFPAIVANDVRGRDLFIEGAARYRRV